MTCQSYEQGPFAKGNVDASRQLGAAGAQLFSAPDMANFDAKVFTHHRQVRRRKYLTTATMAQHLHLVGFNYIDASGL